MKKVIMGREYDYTLCSRCEVWILTEDFSGDAHKTCDHNYVILETRRRAENRVLGRLSPCL